MQSVFILCLLIQGTVFGASLLDKVYKSRSAVLAKSGSLKEVSNNCISKLFRPYYHLINAGYFGNPSAENLNKLLTLAVSNRKSCA